MNPYLTDELARGMLDLFNRLTPVLRHVKLWNDTFAGYNNTQNKVLLACFLELYGYQDRDFQEAFNHLPLERMGIASVGASGQAFESRVTQRVDHKVFTAWLSPIGIGENRSEDSFDDLTAYNVYWQVIYDRIGYENRSKWSDKHQIEGVHPVALGHFIYDVTSGQRKHIPPTWWGYYIQFPSWCRLYPTDFEVLIDNYEQREQHAYEGMYS